MSSFLVIPQWVEVLTGIVIGCLAIGCVLDMLLCERTPETTMFSITVTKTYSISLDPPLWFSRPLLAWVARLLGIARSWEARGVGLQAFDRDVRRLALSKGLSLRGSPTGGYVLSSAVVTYEIRGVMQAVAKDQE